MSFARLVDVAETLMGTHYDVLLTAARDREITEAVALRRQDQITEMKIRVLGEHMSRRVAWKIARENGWDTTFDVEYIAVCQLQADALVTVDRAFAALAANIVPVAPLTALYEP